MTAIPASHPYVTAVTGPTGGDEPGDSDPSNRAADVRPDPVVDPDEPGRWWPHPYLEPGQGAAAAEDADIVHVHFGFEHRNADQLADFADEVHAGGAKLVVTVHDLDCPHVDDQEKYRRGLGVLVERADAVVTLTDSAADECEARFGVRPRVIAHPPIVPAARATDLLERVPRRADVSLSYKNVRRNVCDDPALPRAVAAEVARHDGSRLRIHVFPEVFPDAAGAVGDRCRPELARALRELDDDPVVGDAIVLDVSGAKDDEELHRELAGCSVAVLPYAFGTHSGWLEMCRDLGVRVVAPETGHYAGQADRPGAVIVADMADPVAVAAAVGRALDAGPLSRETDASDARHAAAAAHGALYREVLGW